MHHKISVLHLKTDEDYQMIIADQFGGQSGTASVYALDPDTSSELAYNNTMT